MKRYNLNNEGDYARLAELLAKLNRAKNWIVTVEPDRLEKTDTQNRYYHAIIDEIARVTGNSPKLTKQFVYDQFAPRADISVGGIVRDIAKPREEWSMEETSEFIERLKEFAASELGVMV